MSRLRIAACLFALAVATCDQGTFIKVTLRSTAALSASKLAVTMIHGTTRAQTEVPPPAGASRLSFPPEHAFSLRIDGGRSGKITVDVTALLDGAPVGRGIGEATIVPGGTAEITVTIGRCALDDDCSPGQVCQASGRLCVPGCSAQRGCGDGGTCELDAGVCVECTADAHCAAGTVCSPDHRCVLGCSATHGCGDAGVCDVARAACVECNGDPDCRDKAAPRCLNDRCVACLQVNDNCPMGTYCSAQGAMRNCVPGCKNDKDCPVAQPRCELLRNQCVACLVDGDCAMGSVCRNNTCTVGCSLMKPCPGAQTCCSGFCAVLGNDVKNCGGCGNACPMGGLCCGAACVNPANDVKHCGACGMSCGAPNGTPSCVNRACAIGGCNQGFANCDQVVINGCETNIESNLAHCGGCGMSCSPPNAVPKCSVGKCVLSACNAGFGDCDGLAVTGCEADLGSNLMHCGGCRMQCAPAEAVPKCSGGQCLISSCNMGFGDCDRKPESGCEIPTHKDPDNCGACGQVCSSNHIARACANGMCSGVCNAGFADCNADKLRDGCEVALLIDPKNCGLCGRMCGINAPNCVNGACRQ